MFPPKTKEDPLVSSGNTTWDWNKSHRQQPPSLSLPYLSRAATSFSSSPLSSFLSFLSLLWPSFSSPRAASSGCCRRRRDFGVVRDSGATRRETPVAGALQSLDSGCGQALTAGAARPGWRPRSPWGFLWVWELFWFLSVNRNRTKLVHLC
jgi:hypothetical protein